MNEELTLFINRHLKATPYNIAFIKVYEVDITVGVFTYFLSFIFPRFNSVHNGKTSLCPDDNE